MSRKIVAILAGLSLIGLDPFIAAAQPAARAKIAPAPAPVPLLPVPKVGPAIKPFKLAIGSYLGPEAAPKSLFEKALEKFRRYSRRLDFVSKFEAPFKKKDEASVRRLSAESKKWFDFSKETREKADELPPAEGAADPVAQITGALTRRHADPGAIRKMWFVYEADEEKEAAKDVLERVRRENPGVEIVYFSKDKLFSKKDIDQWGSLPPDKIEPLFKRLLEEKVDLVLGSNYDVYETFRALRDHGYARELPFGYTGRRFVSIDWPRRSLDPAKLSDPRLLPQRKTLLLSSVPKPSQTSAKAIGQKTGMEVATGELKAVLETAKSYTQKEKLGRDLNKIMDKLTALSFQVLRGDNREMRALRHDSRLLAAYLEREKVDALVIEDPAVARIVGEMKREGYHVSLPVVWRGKGDPGDASGINRTLRRGAWLAEAPWVQVQDKPDLAAAVSDAVKAPRLPDNFGRDGGVPASGYEKTLEAVTRRPIPENQPRRYRVHVLLTYGNGVAAMGDNNQFGHLGVGIEDENGNTRVWTVQYNDEKGGAFTGGGLTAASMLTLGEYLYGTHYLPGTAGQAESLGETYTAPILDIQFDVDQAGRDAMFDTAARLNVSHLQGEDAYNFVNGVIRKRRQSNCASLGCDILRGGGENIPDSGTHIPADKAVQAFRSQIKKLLYNKLDPEGFDITLYDRAYHSASDHYKIANTPTGTNLINFRKPWFEMSKWEILASFLRHPLEFLNIPKEIDAIAAMASRRVVLLPNSRELTVLEHPQSPVYKMRESSRAIAQLRAARPAIEQERRELLARILEKFNLTDFRVNPGQDLASYLTDHAKTVKLSAQDAKAVDGWLARYAGLGKQLDLNKFDEILNSQKLMFMKLRLADADGRYRRVLGPLQAIYLRIVKIRARLENKDGGLTPKEIKTLIADNEKVEEDLKALSPKILAQIDLPAGLDLRRILGDDLTEQTLRDLQKKYSR